MLESAYAAQQDLFELEKMAFAVEIALAVAEKDTSAVQIRNKQDLYHALTDRETLYKTLEQALDYLLSDRDTFEEKSKQNLCKQYQKKVGLLIIALRRKFERKYTR